MASNDTALKDSWKGWLGPLLLLSYQQVGFYDVLSNLHPSLSYSLSFWSIRLDLIAQKCMPDITCLERGHPEIRLIFLSYLSQTVQVKLRFLPGIIFTTYANSCCYLGLIHEGRNCPMRLCFYELRQLITFFSYICLLLCHPTRRPLNPFSWQPRLKAYLHQRWKVCYQIVR